MSYLAFARKFRPQQLDDVVGQDHIVQTIKNAFLQERIAQSFLFVGTRGVGKTSTARIIAKALNCLDKEKKKREPFHSCGECASCIEITNGSGLDVLEIDGASNRGIDEIRNLRDNVKFKPMNGFYKVYIIDEVHMLTQEAFNALLKTLEEPPPHVKFIFATTEPHKIPQTILSRCQRYDFRHIKTAHIVDTLMMIAKKEKIKVDDKTLYLVAKNAEGSMRDAESLFDKLANSCAGEIVFADALHILGVTDSAIYHDLVKKTIERDVEGILTIVLSEEERGKDLIHFMKGLVEVLRDMLVIKTAKKARPFLQVPDDDFAQLQHLVGAISEKELLYFFTVVQNTYRSSKLSNFPKIDIETALLKVALREDIQQLADIVADLEHIKKHMRGNVSPPSATQVPSPRPAAARAPLKQVIPQPEVARVKKAHANPSAQHGGVKKLSGDGVDIFQSSWSSVVEEVKKVSMSIGTYLSFGRPASLEGNTLTIAFNVSQKLSKEALDSEKNKKIIEMTIRTMTEKELFVKCVINDVLSASAEQEVSNKMPDEMDNIVKSALNIFQGKIVQGA